MNKDTKFTSAFLNQSRVDLFQGKLIGWFESEGKSYPWRETSDPYAILVSELMLQQTQITTVLKRGFFTRWMAKFPDWLSLAGATEASVLKSWEGLGYYNRARNLQKTARIIVDQFDGRFPEVYEDVISLPGIGRYTAGAVLSFAFGQSLPILDGNVIRVLSRIMAFREPVNTRSATATLWDWAESLTPRMSAKAYNSGVMELGQRVCRKSLPDCEICPVSEFCLGRINGEAEKLPIKEAAKKVTRLEENVLILFRDEKILLAPEKGSRRKGMWRLPEISSEEAADFEECFRFDYAITRYKVNLRVFTPNPAAAGKREADAVEDWFDPGNPENLPAMGSPYLKALSKYAEIREELSFQAENEGDRKQKIW